MTLHSFYDFGTICIQYMLIMHHCNDSLKVIFILLMSLAVEVPVRHLTFELHYSEDSSREYSNNGNSSKNTYL